MGTKMNNNQPLVIHSWPRAIMHLDGDAFFASVEQAMHPELKGRPVITGKERGIVACPSYEAKRAGVKRGMRVFEVKKICPDCVILPSDYETYSLFSKRMMSIIQRFTPVVEEYSIDEGFADLTGLRRPLNMSYEQIAAKIKQTVEEELGITVSIGLSLSKSLAKLSSKLRKPSGLTVVSGRKIHLLLERIALGDVWGFGPNITAYLQKLGLKTALDFAKKPMPFAEKKLGKIGREIWQELNGKSVYEVLPELKDDYKSIMKGKTFTPPSSDKEFIWAQLVRNIESACIKARRHHLTAKKLIVFLRKQTFQTYGSEIKLTRPSVYPGEITDFAKETFDRLYCEGVLYRSTGIVLASLAVDDKIQYSLFDDVVKIEKVRQLYSAADEISGKFGKHAVHLASSLPVTAFAQHLGDRGDVVQRKKELLKGETKRKRLGLPYLFIKV